VLNGAITALITPMINNGEVDYVALDKLIELQIAEGVIAVVVIGSTGEAANLDNDEKLEVIEHTIKQVNKRVKVIVGVGFVSTHASVSFVRLLNAIDGINYLLVSTPSYVKPTQEGLYQHFMAIAEVSNVPIMLYNVPGRTACNLEDATTLRLAKDCANIVGIKDATGDIARCSYLVKYKRTDFMLFTGDDATALAFVLCGGNGAISVVSNLVPSQYSRMMQLALQGKIKQAIELNNQILELYNLMFLEANPIPIKWALFNAGIINSPECRLPLTTLTNASQEVIKPFLVNIMNGETNAEVRE